MEAPFTNTKKVIIIDKSISIDGGIDILPSPDENQLKLLLEGLI